jgi:hypothetical protein
MMQRDHELNRALRTWAAPETGKGLDARVWKSYRQSKPARSGNARWWMAAAAAVVLVVSAAHFRPPVQAPVRLASSTNVHGYRPLPNGTITVVKGKRK